MIFFLIFSSNPYVETPILNRLVKTVQMRGLDEGSRHMVICRINKNP